MFFYRFSTPAGSEFIILYTIYMVDYRLWLNPANFQHQSLAMKSAVNPARAFVGRLIGVGFRPSNSGGSLCAMRGPLGLDLYIGSERFPEGLHGPRNLRCSVKPKGHTLSLARD